MKEAELGWGGWSRGDSVGIEYVSMRLFPQIIVSAHLFTLRRKSSLECTCDLFGFSLMSKCDKWFNFTLKEHLV